MSLGITDDAYYSAIASVIRSIALTSSKFTPGQMATTIANMVGDSREWVEGCRLQVLYDATMSSVPNSYMPGHLTLEAINLPACTFISGGAFTDCQALRSISLPVCTTVGMYAFEYCHSLEEVSLPLCEEVLSYAFYRCSAITTVSLPSCTHVGNNAFNECTSLTTVYLPVCTNLHGFAGCHNLVSVYLTSLSSVPYYYGSHFESTPIGGYSDVAGRYGSVYVPASLVSDFRSASGWSSFASRIFGA